MEGKCISRKFHLPSLGGGPHGWGEDGAPRVASVPGGSATLSRPDPDRQTRSHTSENLDQGVRVAGR